jgi:hypothetical protein
MAGHSWDLIAGLKYKLIEVLIICVRKHIKLCPLVYGFTVA